jgi:hypothetical protein
VWTATASAEPPAAGKPEDRLTKPSKAAADNSTYSGQQLEIREVTLTDSGEVQVTFNTMPETLYYCPGANGDTTEEGTLLTFVRSFVKAKPKVDYPATRKGDPAKTWDKLILVDAKDKPIFVKSGKDVVKIFPADNSAALVAGKTVAGKIDAGGAAQAKDPRITTDPADRLARPEDMFEETDADIKAFWGAKWAELLKQHDTNGNGRIDGDEIGAHATSMFKARQEYLVKKYDLNGNGKVDATKEEGGAAVAYQRDHVRPRMKRAYMSYDADGDGELNEYERAAMGKDRLEVHYKRINCIKELTAEDRRVLREKYLDFLRSRVDRLSQAKERLAQWDRNGDGELDRAERAAEGTVRRKKYLAEWDTNRDGRVSKDESHARRLKLFDKDGDGHISKEESKAYFKAIGAKSMAERKIRLKRFDKDGDGQVSEKEAIAYLNSISSKK